MYRSRSYPVAPDGSETVANKYTESIPLEQVDGEEQTNEKYGRVTLHELLFIYNSHISQRNQSLDLPSEVQSNKKKSSLPGHLVCQLVITIL